MQALLFDNPMAEAVDLEFKKGEGKLPASLWESFSAMANTHGGVIEVGGGRRRNRDRAQEARSPA